MRTDLDRLPLRKRRELAEAVRIILEDVTADLSLATGRRKAGRVVKILLYGSHARSTLASYQSPPQHHEFAHF